MIVNINNLSDYYLRCCKYAVNILLNNKGISAHNFVETSTRILMRFFNFISLPYQIVF